LNGLRRTTSAVATTAMFFLLSLTAAGSGNPAAPDPDLSQMSLGPKDFAAGTTYVAKPLGASGPVTGSYIRGVAVVSLGGHKVLGVVTEVLLVTDAQLADGQLGVIRSGLNTPAGRKAFAKVFGKDFGGGPGGRIRIKSTTIGAPVSVAAGQDSFRVPVVLRTSIGRIDMPIAFVRVDRAIGLDLIVGYPRTHVLASVLTQVAQLSAGHFQIAFTVKNTVQPTIGGSVQQGQTLTVSPGVWSGAPSSFTYQWNRCSASGTNCAVIPGASSATYQIGTQDSASTLEVAVTGANSVSSSSAPSVATAVVP